MASVVSLSKNQQHEFSKPVHDSIRLLTGLGVEGDAHCGETGKHRSLAKKDPQQPNLRQVHLIHAELLEELKLKGFMIQTGILGENILTSGIDLLSLPSNTILNIGAQASIKITGLRNPCAQLDTIQQGLTKALLSRDEQGALIRKSGVMATVRQGGVIYVDDNITMTYPEEPHQALVCV